MNLLAHYNGNYMSTDKKGEEGPSTPEHVFYEVTSRPFVSKTLSRDNGLTGFDRRWRPTADNKT